MSAAEFEPAGVTTDWYYAPIPEALLYDSTLSAQCVRVYGCLLRHGQTPDHCFPSHARIGGLLGLSERSVARPLVELEKAGWISRTRRNNSRGERIADGYHVHHSLAYRAEERGRDAQSSAIQPRDPARPYRAESRGLEKQREPVNESKEEDVSGYAEPAPPTLPKVVMESPKLTDAYRLCKVLASSLEQRGERINGKAATNAWVREMEALLRIDGRSPEDVERVLRWLDEGADPVSSWWQPNVRSPAKLREKWHTMGEQYTREVKGARRNRSNVDAVFDAAARWRKANA